MNRFEGGPRPPGPEDEESIDDLLREARGNGFLQRLGRSRVKRLAGQVLLGSIIASVMPETKGRASLEAPSAETGTQIDNESQLFFQALNEYDAPDYSNESPNWDDELSFSYGDKDYNLSRRDLTLALDLTMASGEDQQYGTEVSGIKTLADRFPEYTYDVPVSEDSWHTNVSSLPIDVLYGIHPAEEKESKLLDLSSSTTPEERKELGKILLHEGYAFVPKGAMIADGAIIKHQRVGEDVVSQYLEQSNVSPFMIKRFEDSSELVLGLMRDVGQSKLEGRDREDFRTIAAWIVRSEMLFSADFVQITDHVLNPDQADKEEHLFHSMDSWDGKEIPSVLERARTNQGDFKAAVDKYVEFVDGLNHLDEVQKTELKEKAIEYKQKVLDWQDSELEGVFQDRISIDATVHGPDSGEVLKWQAYKAEHLDGYRADAS